MPDIEKADKNKKSEGAFKNQKKAAVSASSNKSNSDKNDNHNSKKVSLGANTKR